MTAFLRSLILIAGLCFAGMAGAASTLLVFGDSLSAGYGIRQDAAWPALLQQRLAERRVDYSVVNASISGETTAGGRSRIAEALGKQRPAIVVIALGANDGLRGLPVLQMRMNLVAMIGSAKAAKARVLLVGMKLPPNYGPAYVRQFEESYVSVAHAEKVPLLPFLLEPLGAGNDDFQSDGLHPTAAAQRKILDHVWPALKPLLK